MMRLRPLELTEPRPHLLVGRRELEEVIAPGERQVENRAYGRHHHPEKQSV